MKFKITGTDEQLGNFWAVCLACSNSMQTYQSIILSSWPLAGNRAWGMCIQPNEKVKNSIGTIRAFAKACGVTLADLTDHEEQLAQKLARTETELHELKQGCDAERMTEAFRRVIDYECYGLLHWMKSCVASADTAQWEKYQTAYNHLFNLRERITSPGWALAYLDKTKFDMPEAKHRIFK